MGMEHLTKSQFILLVLLVTFVASVVTGIVTVTLVGQGTPPITQTVNKVIEKTLERVVPGGAGTPTPAPQETQIKVVTQEELIIKAVGNISPAVVSVIATKDLPVFEEYYADPFGDDPFFQQFFRGFQVPQYRQKGTEKRQISSGTGFFVSEDGHLLTNKHVVVDEGAEYSVIMNDGRQFAARVLAKDPIQDVAVLKVDAGKFPYVPLGNSDALEVGQTVIAIGNTLGEFQNTVSVGVLSGLNRTVTASDGAGGAIEQLQGVIQTDAAINPGNSGGPLVNLSGSAIGINTAMAQGAENVGFALPINIAKKGLADAKESGKITYAFLGVRYVAINVRLKEEKKLSVDYGILISKGSNGEDAVIKDSPAEKAGIKEGDIILEFGGVRLDQNSTLAKLISTRRTGETVSLKALREGKEIEISVTLDERPENL